MTEPTGLPPEQEAVRRLLADARHDGATPPEVVTRLDETLASLVAERRDTPPPVAPDAPVVDLGARRRRLAGVGLLAAAAVVVAGVAIGQALPRMQGSDDAGSSAGGDSTTSQRDLGAESSEAEDDAAAGSSELAPESPKSFAPSPRASLPSVSVADPALADRLLELRSDASSRTAGQPSTPDVDGTCLMRGIGPGRRLQVAVDGQPGTVVYQPPSGDAQGVAVYVCGSGEPVRTLTLPAP
jgi:hypothetical protein